MSSRGRADGKRVSALKEAQTDEVDYVFRDLFFVKYECAEGGQRSVGLHRDGSDLRYLPTFVVISPTDKLVKN